MVFQWGYPKLWMVYFRENPMQKRMITGFMRENPYEKMDDDLGVPHDVGNLQILTNKKRCCWDGLRSQKIPTILVVVVA